ncbi:hypothetical protein Tco_0121476 [Tanacetum coccineum]
MAQHVLPVSQLVSQYKPIGRCNNYAVLRSIPCSPECKIVGLILLDHCLIHALTETNDVPAVYLQQFWRTVSRVLDTEDTIKFMLDTQQFTYTMDMFRDTLYLPVETPENPFVAPANIHTIEAFMNRVGYQGVVDKVSAFFTKNLAQPWQTMFKVFNRCLTTRTSGHDQTKINILQLFHVVLNQTHVDYAALLWWDFMNNVFQKKEAIQYPRFIKLIVADLMKKFPNIPKRLEEDYHSIKDDVPLVSVYTTGNVLVRGMLIPDVFLTAEIRETNDFKEYETMFMKVAIPMNQPQPVVSTQGTHRITPSAHKSPTNYASPPKMKKRKQIAGESSSPKKLLKITIKQKQIVEKDNDDSEDRIEPVSHKDNPEVVNDNDDKEREKQDDEMGSLEVRNEETQTTIPTPLSSPRNILSSDKKTFQELTDIVSNPIITTSKHSQVKKIISSKYSHLPGALRRMCRRQGYMSQDMERKCVTTEKFWETHNKIDDILHEVIPQIAENVTNDLIEANLKPCIVNTIIDDRNAFRSEIKRSLQDRADNITLWEALRYKFEKSSTYNTSCRADDFHSHHDEHQDDDAPPEGEKRVKRSKKSKSSKMEATLRDSLSNLSRNAKEYAYHLEQSTSFMENQLVWESRQQDIPRTIPKTLIFYGPQRNLNEPPRPLYNKDLFFLKYGNTEEKKYILSFHKIHAEEFPKPDLEEKLNRWVRKEFKTFNEDARLSIQHWKDSWHKRVYNKNQKKVKKNLKDYYSNHRITEVVRIVTDQPHGLDFMEQILVNLTAPTLTFPGIEEYAPYTIVDKLQMGFIYLNSKYEKRVMYLEEIVKFCDATLEKVLNEVKLRMFESKFLKKPPLLGELDQDIMKAYEREISKRLSHR